MADDVAAVLASKRAELEAELAALSAPTGDAADIGFGKRIGEGTSIAVDRLSLVATHDRLDAMLAGVKRAQARLADGTYGTCERCGAPIPAERLSVLPWATRCVACPSPR